MHLERRKYRKYHNLQFADEEIYDEIVGLINLQSVEFQKKNGADYRKTLFECLNIYKEIVEDTIPEDCIIKRTLKYCKSINDIVKASYEGRHNRAYEKLKNLIAQYGDSIFVVIPEDSEFYRMRVTDQRKNLERKDIFHIPLNMRRCIKTQRYSTPGYPCLYLGKSLYVCWEEMDMPSTESTLVAGFKNVSEIKLVDLRIPKLQDFLLKSDIYVYLFPLIIASSIPVLHRDDVFKPEYILPQLILEWTINQKRETLVCGVYYTSVFKNSGFFSSLDEEWNNIAIPVQNPLNRGLFCPNLKQMFRLTKPTCYEYEHVKGKIDAVGFLDDGPERLISCAETKRDYYMSQFSRMEELLLKRKYDYVDKNDPE